MLFLLPLSSVIVALNKNQEATKKKTPTKNQTAKQNKMTQKLQKVSVLL